MGPLKKVKHKNILLFAQGYFCYQEKAHFCPSVMRVRLVGALRHWLSLFRYILCACLLSKKIMIINKSISKNNGVKSPTLLDPWGNVLTGKSQTNLDRKGQRGKSVIEKDEYTVRDEI